MQPLPPLPALTKTSTSSTNVMARGQEGAAPRPRACGARRARDQEVAARTLTRRRPARSSKRTWPSVLANRVKSRPSPTLTPGQKRVPRWRTRMEPCGTHCPAKRLTPSILGWLSRPLRELPTPFLCAIAVSALPAGRRVDPRDPDGREFLSVPLASRVVLPALELEDPDLLPAAHLHDLTDDPCPGEGTRLHP